MMREKNEAASMTPAAKPRRLSWIRIETTRPNSTGIAPTAVIAPAARLARVPVTMMFIAGPRLSP
jgi:hypothetical protein